MSSNNGRRPLSSTISVHAGAPCEMTRSPLTIDLHPVAVINIDNATPHQDLCLALTQVRFFGETLVTILPMSDDKPDGALGFPMWDILMNVTINNGTILGLDQIATMPVFPGITAIMI